MHLRGEASVEDAEAAISLMRFSLEQVGIDVATGMPDIDLIMTGKPRSLQMKLQTVLGVIIEMERVRGSVADEDLFADPFSERIRIVPAAGACPAHPGLA